MIKSITCVRKTVSVMSPGFLISVPLVSLNKALDGVIEEDGPPYIG